MAMRGFFIDNAAFEKYHRRIGARRMYQILKKASDSTMFPEDPERGDKMFVPRTDAESEYWQMLRDDIKLSARRYLANVENGKRGGRPRKNADTAESDKPSGPAPMPKLPPVPPAPQPASPQTNIQRAAQCAQLVGKLGRTLGNTSGYKTYVIDAAFDLTKLHDDTGDLLRLHFPPNRTTVLRDLSNWLRNKMMGETVDCKWLFDKAKQFAQNKK